MLCERHTMNVLYSVLCDRVVCIYMWDSTTTLPYIQYHGYTVTFLYKMHMNYVCHGEKILKEM